MSVRSRIIAAATQLATTVTMSVSPVITARSATTRKTTVTAATKAAVNARNAKNVQPAMSALNVTNAQPVNCVQPAILSSHATAAAHKQWSKALRKNHVRHVLNVNCVPPLMNALPALNVQSVQRTASRSWKLKTKSCSTSTCQSKTMNTMTTAMMMSVRAVVHVVSVVVATVVSVSVKITSKAITAALITLLLSLQNLSQQRHKARMSLHNQHHSLLPRQHPL